jgi:hypothetical protein
MTYCNPHTKTAMLGQMLVRPEGCTGSELKEAAGWPSMNVPAIARRNDLHLRAETRNGKKRYFGTPYETIRVPAHQADGDDKKSKVFRFAEQVVEACTTLPSTAALAHQLSTALDGSKKQSRQRELYIELAKISLELMELENMR